MPVFISVLVGVERGWFFGLSPCGREGERMGVGAIGSLERRMGFFGMEGKERNV